eukprot:TRINITY_DN17004_c0_g1_i1.p1 TRINITY_DN17004_c0_g1~~TRINITY_DN17004_c0_g1_i1.p1  ORF type:complete len:504 (+),score=52.01 TRINITY_DN17004_c0_g1_i1:183-1694(+)
MAGGPSLSQPFLDGNLRRNSIDESLPVTHPWDASTDGQSAPSPRTPGGGRATFGAMLRSSSQVCVAQMSKQEILEQTEQESPPVLQTELQTVLNTVNLYVGVGLLSTGYAVKLGGWVSLLVLALSTYVFSWTAKLLCWAAEALPPDVPPSYPNIGKAALGPAGQWLVMGSVLLEFWGAQGMCLIVLWQSIALLLPAGPFCIPFFPQVCLSARYLAVACSTLLVVPAVLIRSFSRLTSVSLSGVAGSILLCAVVLIAYALDPHSAQVELPAAHLHEVVHWRFLPIAAGIFIVSLSGHAGLPSLRRSMQRPQNFESCINATFFIMFCLYASMGACAYAYFGDSLQVLITASLDHSSSVAGFLLINLGPFSVSVSEALTVLVILSVYSTIPPLVYVMAELVVDLAEGRLHRHPAAGFLEPAVRLLVLLIGYVSALIGYDVLAHVESLVGGVCSVMVSLVLPAFVFWSLRGRQLPMWQQFLLWFLIVFGCCVMGAILVQNILELSLA